MGKLFLALCQVAAVGFIIYALASVAVIDPLAFVMDNQAQVEQLGGRK